MWNRAIKKGMLPSEFRTHKAALLEYHSAMQQMHRRFCNVRTSFIVYSSDTKQLPRHNPMEKIMKAIIYTKYGSSDVLQYTDCEKPVPGDDQVLVRIHATSLNSADLRSMHGRPLLFRPMWGFPRPNKPILGGDLAGIVEAVGRNVTQVQTRR